MQLGIYSFALGVTIMPRIKIYGLTSLEDALAAVEMGASALDFV